MLKKSDLQASFLDADYICDRLVPQDSFYRKFKELVAPLIKDEHFEGMCLNIFNSLQKGIRVAKGKYFIFLNLCQWSREKLSKIIDGFIYPGEN